ncbi:MAG: zinc dependent phospholipase C family protein [Atopobiaceae bacterium]|nr:zinc dependent phospholipase C family protein [Atopobiaceae bacterium]
MPAIITHHLFGEDASRRLPAKISFSEEELLAFLLGNQGPDPFYFCFTASPAAIQTCHTFAETMHNSSIVDALLVAKDAASHLPSDDQAVGKAFVLGLVAHYLLDSEAHAFILAQENDICNAGVGLEDAHDQVHALIESDLDTWMLWSARQQTIADAPAWADLARTERIGRAAGAIFSQVAWQAFGMRLTPERYEGCLRDYEMVYRAIDPTGNPRGRMIAGAERLGTQYSRLDALSHASEPIEHCPAANLDCRPWIDPLTGETKTTSFPDIFYDSLDLWPDLAETFVKGDREGLVRAMRRSYYGEPLAD